jgi:hypothetical protein
VIQKRVLDGITPLLFTEGPIKAGTGNAKGLTIVSTMGVAGWWDDDPFWLVVPLKDRQCLIVFDSDNHGDRFAEGCAGARIWRTECLQLTVTSQ